MEEIHDKTQIEHWIGKGNIRGYFDTPNVTFHAYRYEKGEYITVPDQRMDAFLQSMRLKAPHSLGTWNFPTKGSLRFLQK